MRYKLTLQMDLAMIDENYPDIIKHRRKKAIGDPITISGTEEEIIEKLNEIVYELVDFATEIYVDGEENVMIQ